MPKLLKLLMLIGGGVGVVSSSMAWFYHHHSPAAQTALISPLTSGPLASGLTDYNEQPKSISYYITTSQEFLNKARWLADESANREQTPEEKQKIIVTINQALDLANQTIATYPNDDRGFSQRANIYQALTPFLPESAKFAIQDLKEAIKLNGQNPQYYLRLANLYLIASDFENAALSFYNAHLLNPTETQILYNLADALEKAGQLNPASFYFEKLLSLLPPNDQNLSTIKKRQQQIISLLVQSGSRYLSEPGAAPPMGATPPMIEVKSKNPPELIGTQELPLEQAALANKVIIASENQPLTTASQEVTIAVNAKTGGGIIPAGQTEVTVENKNVANDKQIVIVPTGETQNKVVFLTAKKIGEWFKVGIDSPTDIDIKFNWWIVD